MGDKLRQKTDDCMMSWAGFWAYMSSSLVTVEDREWTMAWVWPHLLSLDTAKSTAQFEILEYAPDSVRSDPRVVRLLKVDVKSKLHLNSQPEGDVDMSVDDISAAIDKFFSTRKRG